MRVGGACVLALLGLALATAAAAHSVLERAEPRVGSTVRAPPPEVRLWFSERLGPGQSRLAVLDSAGARVDLGASETAPAQLRALLPRLPPGRYRVVWHAVSADGHAVDGDFEFTVAP